MLDARYWILDKDKWILTDELFLFNFVQEEDIAAEAVSAPVRLFGYDIKTMVNGQGRIASSWKLPG
jgi:hypothetical protein